MKKRYLYSLLFGIPGFLLAGIATLLSLGFGAGILWIFVFGDNPWPPAAETVLSIELVLVFLITWLVILAAGFWTGKHLESNPGLNKNHILFSASLTAFLLLAIVLFLARSH